MTFYQSAPMMMYGVLDAVMPAYRRLFNKHGLTEQQWRVLRILWEQPSQSSIDISRQTLIRPNSLVGVLERLEKRGYIARVRSVDDRRIVFAKLTPAGRTLGAAIAPELNDIHKVFSDRLTDEEWTELSLLLDKLSTSKTAATMRKETGHG